VTIQLGVMLQQYRATKFSIMTTLHWCQNHSNPKWQPMCPQFFLHPWSPRCNSSSYG